MGAWEYCNHECCTQDRHYIITLGSDWSPGPHTCTACWLTQNNYHKVHRGSTSTIQHVTGYRYLNPCTMVKAFQLHLVTSFYSAFYSTHFYSSFNSAFLFYIFIIPLWPFCTYTCGTHCLLSAFKLYFLFHNGIFALKISPPLFTLEDPYHFLFYFSFHIFILL